MVEGVEQGWWYTGLYTRSAFLLHREANSRIMEYVFMQQYISLQTLVELQ